MAAKPKMGNLVINMSKAIVVQCRDPWYTKHIEYRRFLPPWSKLRKGFDAIKERPAMLKAVETFTKAASATKNMERWARREALSRALRGKSYGGAPKKAPARKVSVEEALAAIRAVGV
jgi:hypothetical protein